MDITSFSRYDWAPLKLAELLPRAPLATVADIGAMSARMQAPTLAAGGRWQGFDLDPQSSDVERWNLDEPRPDLRVGVAMMLDVVEHLSNPWRAMQNVADVIASGGYLLLTTPNPGWSRNRLYNLYTGTLNGFTQSDLDLNHHVFTPWFHIVRRLLEDIGLELVSRIALDGRSLWPGRPFNHRYPLRLGVAAALKFIEHRDPTACGMSYGVVARKP
jgi:SAM-dependent methyltransferase